MRYHNSVALGALDTHVDLYWVVVRVAGGGPESREARKTQGGGGVGFIGTR